MQAATSYIWPVENIELLSRYGSEDQEAQLDKLGWRCLASAQGEAQETYPRDRRRSHQDRCRTGAENGAGRGNTGRRLRRVRHAIPV